MYIMLMESQTENRIGKIIKQRRVSIPMTLNELGSNSGVSQSHIGRIERGERFPSAHVLRKLSKTLGFQEEELFMLAGFLSTPSNNEENSLRNNYHYLTIDPFVAEILAREPAETQRAVIGILSLLKSIARGNK
jgi:transcriptional regulator with XRE-family HTH domain